MCVVCSKERLLLNTNQLFVQFGADDGWNIIRILGKYNLFLICNLSKSDNSDIKEQPQNHQQMLCTIFKVPNRIREYVLTRFNICATNQF